MRIPGYDVGERLARSEALDVHAAWSCERDCPVIVKTLRPDRRSDERAARALRREGALLRRLSHPHLVRAYEVVDGPVPAVVLEMLSGETLAHLIDRRARRLSARELGFLGEHLCSAIGYLHGKGYLHLDLKPSNVVADGGRAKVIDLSIARRPGIVRAGLGTPHYLSPEQEAGGRVGAAADVWGIGAVLFEAATGELPEAGTPVRALRRLPARFAEAIDGALAHDPAERPPLAELVSACRAVTR